jgi:thiamine biosynthesis lipoprotein
VIDPKTGRSAHGLRSVTILAEDGVTSEGLSKSVFVKGLAEGMRLVESQEGVDAIVIDAEGALHYSSGLLGAAPQSGNPGRQ